ncbi:MAG: hypothetical protein AABY06_00650 [Nanoarchaeota archaeon]
MSSSKTLLWILGLLILIFLIWGFIGGSKAKDIGITCDFGISDGKTFCWKWHKNAIGEIQDGLNDLGKSIGDSIQKLN